jgi:nucleoside-diphosphate-sugar epimerase
MLVLGSGQQIRCFTWIGDVADAIARFSFSGQAENEDFNLGNPEPVTMIELARRIFALYHDVAGRRPQRDLEFTHAPTFADDVQVRIPAVDKARRILGWAPTVRLDEMLRRCLAAELNGVPSLST